MKLKIVSLVFVFALSVFGNNCYAKEYSAAPPDKKAPALAERFPSIDKKNYAVEVYKGPFAKDIADKKHLFRTRAREALKNAREKGRGNFAGHYVFFEYGCGTGCVSSNVVDVKTGKIFDGIGVGGYPVDETWVVWEFDYKPDSTLIYVQGSVNSGDDDEITGSGSFVFEFKDGKFKLLQHSPVVKAEEE